MNPGWLSTSWARAAKRASSSASRPSVTSMALILTTMAPSLSVHRRNAVGGRLGRGLARLGDVAAGVVGGQRLALGLEDAAGDRADLDAREAGVGIGAVAEGHEARAGQL